MKPRSKYQQHVVDIASLLPQITDAQRKYCENHAFPLVAFRNQSKGWCTHCGGNLKFSYKKDKRQIVCPHCGKRLEIEDCAKRIYKATEYFTIITVFKGFQVCRHFFCNKMTRRGNQATFTMNEVVQNWIDSKGKETVLARCTIPFTTYYDYWDFSTSLTVKYKIHNYAYSGSRYDIVNTNIYPIVRLLKEAKRNGVKELQKCAIPCNILIASALKDPQTEYLLKHDQIELLRYKLRYLSSDNTALADFASVKVACKHHYKITDPSTWIDHISILKQLGLDTHNPHYICPVDLEDEHAKLIERKHKIDEKKRREEVLVEASKLEELYRKQKSAFFGIKFSNGSIFVSVIQSVADMAVEGITMHHCVFDAGYYKKENSLILSAHDKYGNRLETIEVSLNTFEILQCHGKFNKNTPLHEEILDLVNTNMYRIKDVA